MSFETNRRVPDNPNFNIQDYLLASLFEEWCGHDQKMMMLMKECPFVPDATYFLPQYSEHRKECRKFICSWLQQNKDLCQTRQDVKGKELIEHPRSLDDDVYFQPNFFIPNCLSDKRYNQDFVEIELLGKGGFGSVSKVFHKLDRKIYAVKKIPIQQANDNLDNLDNYECSKNYSSGEHNYTQELVLWNNSYKPRSYQMFVNLLQEVRILASINHPNIVRYYSSWVDNKLLYIQMEYYPQTLRQFLNYRNYSNAYSLNPKNYECLDLQIKTKWTYDLISGLYEIHHHHQVVHHDLSPNNIFLCQNKYKEIYSLKIGDFGLSTKQSVITQKILQGQTLYLAPEKKQKDISRQQSVIDLQSHNNSFSCDIYSLGLIFIEIWVPFQSDMERIIVLSDPLNKIKTYNLNINLLSLIQKMCHLDPKKRPTIKEISDQIQ